MAKITGPLHSDDASGLYGGKKTGIVYSGWRRTRYVRTRVDPKNPRSVKQHRQRTILACCNAIWATFSDPEKAYWTTFGLSLGLPGWQSFCKYNLLQAGEGWMPQMEKNEEHLGTPTAPTATTASVIDNAIIATWTDGTLSYTSAVHLGTTAGFSPAMSNIVYATPATDGGERQATILVAAGTYYLKTRSGDEDGGTGAATIAIGPLVVS